MDQVKVLAIGITFVLYDLINYHLYKFAKKSKKQRMLLIVSVSLWLILNIINTFFYFNAYLFWSFIGMLIGIHYYQLLQFLHKENKLLLQFIMVYFITQSVVLGYNIDQYDSLPFNFLFDIKVLQGDTIINPCIVFYLFYTAILIICFLIQRKTRIKIIFNYDKERDKLNQTQQYSVNNSQKSKYMIEIFILLSLFCIVFMNANLVTYIRTFGRYASNGLASLITFLIFLVLTYQTIKFVTCEDAFNICAISSFLAYCLASIIDKETFSFSNLTFSFDSISYAFTSINITIIPIYFHQIINIFSQLSYLQLSIGFYITSISIQYRQLSYGIDYECLTTNVSTTDAIQYTYGFLNLLSIAYIYLFIHIINSMKIQQKFKHYQLIK